MTRKNVTGNGASEEEVAAMLERIEAAEKRAKDAEAERDAARAQQGALKFKFNAKGDRIGNTGNVRKADCWTVSGGRIGYPITHGRAKWLAIGEEMPAIVARMKKESR